MKVTSITSLAMAKIKDYNTVPQYLWDMMAGIVWDDWVGDQPDGQKCTKYACKYGVGKVWFYFVFSRGSYTSTGETPSGSNYLFRALVAHRLEDTKWFGKNYSPSDLDDIKLAVDTQDDGAIEFLKLEETNLKNPLLFA